MTRLMSKWLKLLFDQMRATEPNEPFNPTSDPPQAGVAASASPETLDPYQTLPQQHPLAPEKDPPPLDWGRWSRMARTNQRRGWSFARYAVRGPTGQMACLFGIVRGPWGIAQMDFYVCESGYATLSAITHLPSGIGCGLFTDRESAANACEIAARLADDWEMFELRLDTARSREAVLHMHQAWTAAGIVKCSSHAHSSADHDSASLPIWTQDHSAVVMGRPEVRLS